MKKTTQIIIALLLTGNLFAQSYPTLMFRKPTTSDNITFKFASVTSGVDAFVSIIGSKNATLDKIDDSTIYKYAWQPYIKFKNNANSTDSSYVDFSITFKSSSTGLTTSLSKMAMTVVDLDGNGIGSYREMVASSLPATPKGLIGSAITTLTGLSRITMISGLISYSTTDTSNFLAMSQLNYSNVSSYTMRVGVVGNVTANTTRQYSFYFKNFASLLFVLPVKLIDLKAEIGNEVPTVKWTTTEEDNVNRFEVYRSIDGINFTLAGTVNANGNTQMLTKYDFADNGFNASSASNTYYKLRIINNNGEYNWSKMVSINMVSSEGKTVVASVYPNPSKGDLNISFSSVSENDFTIEVVDMFGKVYRSINSTDFSNQYSLSLDLNDLSNGVYFVKVTESNGSSNTTKFIRN